MAALGIKKALALGETTLLNDGHVTGTGTLDFYIPVQRSLKRPWSWKDRLVVLIVDDGTGVPE